MRRYSVLCRLVALSVAGFVVLCVQGCVSPAEQQADRAVQAYFVGDCATAKQTLQPLATKTDENFALNNCRLGSASLCDCDLSVAESAFLRAYEVMNSVGVNDGGRTLGAVLVDEKIKIWKGEPFERAMTNFYLGLVYYMQHDYNNARAAFENALFKLRDYSDPNHPDRYTDVQSDFVLADLMLGRCWQRLGRDDKAQNEFDRVTKLRPDLAQLADPRLNGESNLLLVVDYGWGPRKIRNGDGALVGFSPNPVTGGPIPLPYVFVDNQRLNVFDFARPPVDLLALAQDRRWESIDTVRAVKSAIGTGLIAGGAAYGVLDRNANPYVALGLMAGGLLLKATSQADVREWGMLPRTVFIIPLKVAPGTHDVTVDFGYEKQSWRGLTVPEQGEATYYFRMNRYMNGVRQWPPPSVAPPPPVASADPSPAR